MALKRQFLNVPNYSIALSDKDANNKDWFKYFGDVGSSLITLEDDLNTSVSDITTEINTLTSSINQNTPPGVVFEYAGSSAPTGWLLCDGSAISRTTYSALFAIIGTTYGTGDGSTTFNLPDKRGRTGIGAGTGTGLSARTLGSTVGAETHQLTRNEMPSHAHSYLIPTFPAGATFVTGGGAVQVSNAGATTGSEGGDQAHNNMQPSLVMNYIIKY